MTPHAPPLYILVAAAAMAAMRVMELGYAKHRARGLHAMGARFVKKDGYGAIVVVQSLVLAGCLAEPAFVAPHWPAPAIAGAVLVLLGILLRYWSMAHLGPRWSTRVFVLPEAPLVTRGPYAWFRHPIYLGVTLELVGLPLVCGAWWTLAVVVPLHVWATSRRIRIEERALGIADRRPE